MSAHCSNCIRRWPQRNPGCPLCRECPFCLPLWLNAGWRCHQCSNTRRVTGAHFGCTLLGYIPFATLVHMTTFCGLDDTWGRLHWINRSFRTVMRQRNRLAPSYEVQCRDEDCRREHPGGGTFNVVYHAGIRRCELICVHCETFRWTPDHPIAAMMSPLTGVP